MFIKKNKKFKLSYKLFEYFEKNIKEYFIFCVFLIIGVILGIIFINNFEISKLEDIKNYINDFINNYKESNLEINNFQMFKLSVKNNLIINAAIWFLGSTIIGTFLIYGVVTFCGFSLGFTISSLIFTLGIWKGFLVSVGSLLIQNILFVPCIISMAVSSNNLYRCIIKDRRMENIKVVLLKHTIFFIVTSTILIFSSFLEVFISKNILLWLIKSI